MMKLSREEYMYKVGTSQVEQNISWQKSLQVIFFMIFLGLNYRS